MRSRHRPVLLIFHALVVSLLCGVGWTPRVRAADGAPIWTNRFNSGGSDVARAMAVDKSGNVFVTGDFASGNAFGHTNSFATVAYSAGGVPFWTNVFIGPNFNDLPHAIAVDNSGNVFVTGESQRFGFGPNYATVAYSGAGVPLWTNHYYGAGSWGSARALAVNDTGNLFVAGDGYATIAYSGGGVLLWTNRYIGSIKSNDVAYAMVAGRNGNIFVTGWSMGSGGDYDFATLAYSDAGVPLWTNRYNGPGHSNDLAGTIAMDGKGNVFVAGYSLGSGGNYDFTTLAYSDAGVPLWTNRFDGPNGSNDYPVAIAVDANGNVFVAGDSMGSGGDFDFATLAYSNTGVPLWTNYYNGTGNSNDYADSITVDANGNVFVIGTSMANSTGNVYVTIAYSGAGVPLWTNRYGDGGSNSYQSVAVKVDGNGNVVVTGSGGVFSDYVTIKYSAITPSPPLLKQFEMENGFFRFLFSAAAYRSYAVDFTEFLISSNWTTLTNIGVQPIATNIAVVNAITNNARFYRVRTP
jgi:hypothetical protein